MAAVVAGVLSSEKGDTIVICDESTVDTGDTKDADSGEKVETAAALTC